MDAARPIGPTLPLQTKLSVNQAGDAAEQQADSMADQVMRAPAAQSHSDSDTATPTNSPQIAPPIVEQTVQTPGHALDSGTRTMMESRFGADFGSVRVHSDQQAAQSARAVNAAAYTVGQDVVFGAGQYAPYSAQGQRLLAHELAHVLQQEAGGVAMQRTPSAPRTGADPTPFDRSRVDIRPIPDMVTVSNGVGQRIITPHIVSATFNDPAITHMVWEFYDPSDTMLPGSFGTMARSSAATTTPFVIQNTDALMTGTLAWTVTQGRYILRCVGYDSANQPVAYADRTFFIWTSTPTGPPPDIAALQAEKRRLETTTTASGKSFGEVASAFSKLADVTHDLSVLETGTGTYVGNRCAIKPTGTTPTDCTNIVLEVLKKTFTQQGRAADWAKVEKKYAENTKARGGTGMSGLDVQAALQSEAGWKGIFWAPDPSYQIPDAELSGAGIKAGEANYTLSKAKHGTYYKDFGKKGYPGVAIEQLVTNYAPERPNTPLPTGYPGPSTTTKNTTQLDKLKKLPFGVLAAHGGYHMTVITFGKVIEVHWEKEATSVNVIEQTDLDQWAVGPRSGYHYYASGAIVAPAADVDAAFK